MRTRRKKKSKQKMTKRRENNAQRINIYNIENETTIITIYQMFPIANVCIVLGNTGFCKRHWIVLQSNHLLQFKIVLRFFIFKTWHCLNANKGGRRRRRKRKQNRIEAFKSSGIKIWSTYAHCIRIFLYQQTTTATTIANPFGCFCLLLSIQWVLDF